MSIIALNEKNFDVVTLQMHPKRTFSSSSSGLTGSVFVYAQRSTSIKDQALPSGSLTGSNGVFSDENITTRQMNTWYVAAEAENRTQEGLRYPNGTDFTPSTGNSKLFPSASVPWSVSSGSLSASFVTYLDSVSNLVKSPNLKKQVEIFRFRPATVFNSNTVRKSIVINTLSDFYRTSMPNSDFGFTNYNSINFFTASSVSPNRALIYPSPSLRAVPTSGTFAITGSFNISFYINPRYTTPNPYEDFKAGVIAHMSSCYAVSLHTGSGVNQYGYPSTFRIALQLSQSADTRPSEINLNILNNKRSYPQDMIFVSDEHSLTHKHWHHVSINLGLATVGKVSRTWGGTGSFYIDGTKQKKSDFIVASESINTRHFHDFNPLFIGNYYDGTNQGASSVRAFFNATAASKEGVENWGPGHTEDPASALLNHPLNAEFHDFRIYERQLTTNEIITASIQGPTQEQFQKIIKMYLPPFFTTGSTARTVINTPFQAKKQFTTKPFNSFLSFDVDGRDISLQNFVREHRHKVFPRLFHLTSSEISDTTKSWQTANRLLYEFGVQSSYVRARNLTILPCDNGLFRPNFNLLLTQSDPFGLKDMTPETKAVSGTFVYPYRNDRGIIDLSLVTLRDMHVMPTYMTGVMQESGHGTTFADDGEPRYVVQLTESNGWTKNATPQILQLTRDNTSDEICFFDASNLFYGQSIKKGSYSILDKAISGSNTRVSIRLRDDGRGNIFRSDCSTPPATWNSVGNIYYDEGIVLVKAPTIPFFGKDQFEVELEGFQNVHMQEINVNAYTGRINSSSNSSFRPMRPDNYANSVDGNFVAISEILFHDDNLNIVARAKLAQPVVKRLTDKYLFRVKMDY